MSDQKLIDECAALVPGEQIVAAGAFQPRGTQLAMSAGILGIIASRVMAQNAHLPRYAVLAVTPTEILMFRAESFSLGWKPAELVARFPRSSTHVSVQPGVQVRKLTLQPEGGQATALESPRLGTWHGKAVIAALGSA